MGLYHWWSRQTLSDFGRIPRVITPSRLGTSSGSISHPSRRCQPSRRAWRRELSNPPSVKKRRAVPQPDLVGRLGDDPEPLPLAGLVRRQDAAAVDQGGVVEAAVLFVEVAPVAGDVTGEELIRRLTGFVEGMEGTGGATIRPRLNFLVSCLTHVVAPDLGHVVVYTLIGGVRAGRSIHRPAR